MKIQFDIKYRPQIESGEYKVVTRNNAPVRIICWDAHAEQPIVGLVYDGNETVGMFCDNGRFWQLKDSTSLLDLFIITPEPELTEFEKGIKRGFLCAGLEDVHTGIIKDTAEELLKLAKKELCKDCPKKQCNDYRYKGPGIQTYFPPCFNGGPCTNPFYDCINCPHQ